MRRRPALPFRRCGRNCSRSGRGRLRREGGRGFIGLGRMGSAIAARVLSGDHDLLVFNRHPRGRRWASVRWPTKVAGSVAAAQNAPLTSNPLFFRCRITSFILQRIPRSSEGNHHGAVR